MSDEQPTHVVTPQTQSRRFVLRVGLPCAGLALLCVGFLLGRGDQQTPNPASTVCVQASAAAQIFLGQMKTATPQFGSYDRGYWTTVENAANVALQNPQCFSPADRAEAQSLHDNALQHLSSQ